MPASERGIEEVLPEMNQRSSAITARRKTRLVVSRGRIGMAGCVGSEEGRERANRRGVGAKKERVPVPVLQEALVADCEVNEGDLSYLSGRCSPSFKM